MTFIGARKSIFAIYLFSHFYFTCLPMLTLSNFGLWLWHNGHDVFIPMIVSSALKQA